MTRPGTDYFDVMGEFASRHWWYRSRRALVCAALRSRPPAGAEALAIDVGCGSGAMVEDFTGLGFGRVAGTEIDADARRERYHQ